MAKFPKLKTGAVAQYPVTRRLMYATEWLQFVDGSEQAYRLLPKAHREWVIRLERLDEAEVQALERFFVDMDGGHLSFTFTDPFDGSEHPDCSFDTDEFQFRVDDELKTGALLRIRENGGMA